LVLFSAEIGKKISLAGRLLSPLFIFVDEKREISSQETWLTVERMGKLEDSGTSPLRIP